MALKIAFQNNGKCSACFRWCLLFVDMVPEFQVSLSCFFDKSASLLPNIIPHEFSFDVLYWCWSWWIAFVKSLTNERSWSLRWSYVAVISNTQRHHGCVVNTHVLRIIKVRGQTKQVMEEGISKTILSMRSQNKLGRRADLSN